MQPFDTDPTSGITDIAGNIDCATGDGLCKPATAGARQDQEAKKGGKFRRKGVDEASVAGRIFSQYADSDAAPS